MTTSVVPQLIDALVAAASAAISDATVIDGLGVTENPGGYLMIGVDDPDSDGGVFAAESQQGWANANHIRRDEAGEVTCAAYSWSGDGDQKAARDAVYELAGTLAGLCRENPSMGVPELLWTDYGTRSNLTQFQGDWGAAALLVFSIAFRARI